VGFASPGDHGLYDPDRYILRRRRRDVTVPELASDQVYGGLDVLDAWSDPLRTVHIDAYGGGDEVLDLHEPLRNYVVANVSHSDDDQQSSYTLTAGAWFKVDQTYADRLARFVNGVEDLTDELSLPDWDDTDLKFRGVQGAYGEERYNNLVGSQTGYMVLDRDLYHGEVGEKVEVCDLLTSKRQLICVKRMDGSDKMSHLFQQGSTSAELMFNTAYRDSVLERFHTAGGTGDFGRASDWTFVFAIATSKTGPLRDTMTFFSKVALKTHADAISGRGFRVALAKIKKVS
jgi:uncharacterized protein (TIGR04141 family)